MDDDHLPIGAPNRAPPPLAPGDPAPWFVARSDVSARFQISTLGGRKLLIAFLDSLTSAAGRALSEAYFAAARNFPPYVSGLLIVSGDRRDMDAKLPEGLGGSRILFDPERKIAALYGVDYSVRPAATFLLDPLLRIFGIVTAGDPTAHAAAALQHFERAPGPAAARPGVFQAPVLIIPGVFEERLCKDLIDGHEKGNRFQSGFMVERDGLTVLANDPSHKRRTDWMIDDKELQDACSRRIQRRVAPEIQRAYQFDVTRIERFLVACYDDADKGHFAQHRDNTTRGTAHRRFAVSVNLNTGYEGGELAFPEFGQARFKPPPGGACVFSCSLLHQATPVTRGRRFVFVPFLYDEAGKKVRDDNKKFVAPEGSGENY